MTTCQQEFGCCVKLANVLLLLLLLLQADDEAAGLDELRAKTAAKFAAGQEEQQEAPAPKRLKRNL
jgi:hypothetical protein